MFHATERTGRKRASAATITLPPRRGNGLAPTRSLLPSAILQMADASETTRLRCELEELEVRAFRAMVDSRRMLDRVEHIARNLAVVPPADRGTHSRRPPLFQALGAA